MQPTPHPPWRLLAEGAVLVTAHDVAFVVIVLGILLTMTGAFGDPNLVIVGIVVSLAGLIGVLVQPESTLLVLAALIPIVGFLLFYLYRHVQFPRSRGPAQTTSADSLLGRQGRVTEEVTPRQGEIKLVHGGFDPHYRSRTRSGSIPVGEKVVVVARGGGNVLTVARADQVDAADVTAPAEPEEVGWKVVHDLRRALRRVRGGPGE